MKRKRDEEEKRKKEKKGKKGVKSTVLLKALMDSTVITVDYGQEH